jgi:hypothetical protein
MIAAMTTFTLTLLLLLPLTVAVVWTVRLVADGGHGCPPRSHERDSRFGPPAAGVH